MRTTEERLGLYAFTHLAALALVLAPRKTHAYEHGQVLAIADKLVMGIPEDDSPCVEDDRLAYPWGAAPAQMLGAEFGAKVVAEYSLPGPLRESILEYNPERLYLFGHGNGWLFTCELCERFFNSRIGLNLDLVEGRYVHLLSCSTAKELGYKIVEEGALGYFGYYEDFYLIAKLRPCAGRFTCEAALSGDLEIEIQFHNGERDLKKIYDRAIERYNEEISYWEDNWQNETVNGIGISQWEAQMLIDVIIINRDALRCYYPGGQYPEVPDEEDLKLWEATYQAAGVN